MKKVAVLLLACMLMFSFALVLAEEDVNETDSDLDMIDDDDKAKDRLRARIRIQTGDLRSEYRIDIDALRTEYKDDLLVLKDVAQELIATLNESNLTEEERTEVLKQLKELRGNVKEVRFEYRDDARGIRVEFRSELKDFFNDTRTEYRLRSGRNISVKIMPEVASERAIERLGLKVCNESNNCTIEFKEIGRGNETKLAYSLKAKKSGRFLGLFKVRMDVESEVDVETGEVIRSRKPWWAFLVAE